MRGQRRTRVPGSQHQTRRSPPPTQYGGSSQLFCFVLVGEQILEMETDQGGVREASTESRFPPESSQRRHWLENTGLAHPGSIYNLRYRSRSLSISAPSSRSSPFSRLNLALPPHLLNPLTRPAHPGHTVRFALSVDTVASGRSKLTVRLGGICQRLHQSIQQSPASFGKNSAHADRVHPHQPLSLSPHTAG